MTARHGGKSSYLLVVVGLFSASRVVLPENSLIWHDFVMTSV